MEGVKLGKFGGCQDLLGNADNIFGGFAGLRGFKQC